MRRARHAYDVPVAIHAVSVLHELSLRRGTYAHTFIMRLNMYVCIYVCMYIYISIYIYIYNRRAGVRDTAPNVSCLRMHHATILCDSAKCGKHVAPMAVPRCSDNACTTLHHVSCGGTPPVRGVFHRMLYICTRIMYKYIYIYICFVHCALLGCLG